MGRLLILFVVVATLAISTQASGFGIRGPKDPYIKVLIKPIDDFSLGGEISIEVVRVTSIRESPMVQHTVQVSYYQGAHLVTERLKTNGDGVARFTPNVMDKYFVRAGGRLLSFVVGPGVSGKAPLNETNGTAEADGTQDTVLYKRLSHSIAPERIAKTERQPSYGSAEFLSKENPLKDILLITVVCYFLLLYLAFDVRRERGGSKGELEPPREMFSVFEMT